MNRSLGSGLLHVCSALSATWNFKCTLQDRIKQNNDNSVQPWDKFRMQPVKQICSVRKFVTPSGTRTHDLLTALKRACEDGTLDRSARAGETSNLHHNHTLHEKSFRRSRFISPFSTPFSKRVQSFCLSFQVVRFCV